MNRLQLLASYLFFGLTPILAPSLHAQAPDKAAAVSDTKIPARDAVECSPRGGLPHFFAKLQCGETVKVAYLGGSITAQNGWRLQSLAHFQKLFPNAKLEEIFAAIGGTGSNMGVFRMDRDVLAKNPDLLFVEFAVNDSGTRPAEVIRNMEGIVRKTYKAFPNCDICFVYTMTEKNLPEVQSGKMSQSASAMEQVADAYQIPSIHLGIEVARMEKEGKLLFKSPGANVDQVEGKSLDQNAGIAAGPDGKIPFSRDGVHPYNNTGHRLYTEAIARSIPAIKAVPAKLEPHTLRTPVDPENLEAAAMLPLEKAKMSGPWQQMTGPGSTGKGKGPGGSDFSRFITSIWKGEPGAQLAFRFKGPRAAIYDLVGPGCGKLEITVDGKSTQAKRIDSYCTYYRLASVSVASNLAANDVHEVKIKVLDEPLDKAKILGPKGADIQANPAKYQGLDWYAGAVFYVGEWVP